MMVDLSVPCIPEKVASTERVSDLQAAPGQRVHPESRRVYTNIRSIAFDLKQADNQDSQPKICALRLAFPKFEFSKICIFCR